MFWMCYKIRRIWLSISQCDVHLKIDPQNCCISFEMLSGPLFHRVYYAYARKQVLTLHLKFDARAERCIFALPLSVIVTSSRCSSAAGCCSNRYSVFIYSNIRICNVYVSVWLWIFYFGKNVKHRLTPVSHQILINKTSVLAHPRLLWGIFNINFQDQPIVFTWI